MSRDVRIEPTRGIRSAQAGSIIDHVTRLALESAWLIGFSPREVRVPLQVWRALRDDYFARGGPPAGDVLRWQVHAQMPDGEECRATLSVRMDAHADRITVRHSRAKWAASADLTYRHPIVSALLKGSADADVMPPGTVATGDPPD